MDFLVEKKSESWHHSTQKYSSWKTASSMIGLCANRTASLQKAYRNWSVYKVENHVHAGTHTAYRDTCTDPLHRHTNVPVVTLGSFLPSSLLFTFSEWVEFAYISWRAFVRVVGDADGFGPYLEQPHCGNSSFAAHSSALPATWFMPPLTGNSTPPVLEAWVNGHCS